MKCCIYFFRYKNDGDHENSLDLYNVNYGENEIADSYDVLNSLLDLHETDHKISNVGVADPSRQGIVGVNNVVAANSLADTVREIRVFINRRNASHILVILVDFVASKFCI